MVGGEKGVLQALVREGKCGAIRALDVSYSKFVEKYPFLVTGNPSKSRKTRRFYPSEVLGFCFGFCSLARGLS